MKITFIKDHKVKQGDGNGPHYKTGEAHDLERSYAEKYKRLGLAVDYVAPKPAPRGKQKDDGPEAIQIRQDMDGDKRTLYVVKPWPKVTRVTEEMLTGSDAAIVVADGNVTITVANGFATYKIGEEAAGRFRDCELVDSKYEEAPEKK